MRANEINRKIAVIFATDIVGYSKHMENNENEAVKSLRACENILTKLFIKYDGNLFNTGGDSFFAEFTSAVSAVECGAEFQTQLEEYYRENDPSIKLEFRTGINMGDVVKEKKNLLGDGVNIAARLEALAQPNGISISKSVYDLVNGKVDLKFSDLGVQKIKENEFHAYDVLLKPSHKRTLKVSSKSHTPLLVIFFTAVFILGLVGTLYFNSSSETSQTSLKVLTSDKPSVLIMPFENQTGNKDNDFVGLGITSNLISTLSQNESLLIPSGNTGKIIKKNSLPDKKIKDEYGIEYILRGDVQGVKGNFRITIEMTDLSKDEVVWSQMYELKDSTDIFSVQDKLSLSIMERLSVKTKGSLADKTVTKNPEAYKKHIYALSAYGLKTVEGSEKAEKLWNEAIQLDPENVKLQFMLAWVHWRKVTMGISNDAKKDMKTAYEIATKTIKEADPWAAPNALAGLIELFSKKHEAACARIPILLSLTKDISDLSMANLVIHSCGDLENAISNYEKILITNPHHPAWVFYMYTHALIEDKQYEKAKTFCLQKLQENHNWKGVDQTLYLLLAFIHEKEGNKKMAKKMFDKQRAIDGKGKTAQRIHKEFISKKDKTYLNEVIAALKPYGLEDK